MLVQDIETKERFEADTADLKTKFIKYNHPVEVVPDARPYYTHGCRYDRES